MCAPEVQAPGPVAPAAAVVKPAVQLVQPGTGAAAVPAPDQDPFGQMPQVALRPKPAPQMRTAGRKLRIWDWE